MCSSTWTGNISCGKILLISEFREQRNVCNICFNLQRKKNRHLSKINDKSIIENDEKVSGTTESDPSNIIFYILNNFTLLFKFFINIYYSYFKGKDSSSKNDFKPDINDKRKKVYLGSDMKP